MISVVTKYERSTSTNSLVATESPASGATKLAVSSPVTTSGTPQLSPLPSTIQAIAVTSNGPVWGSGGGGSNNVVIGVLPGATDPATSNGGTASNQTGIKSTRTLSGGEGILMRAPQTISLGTSQGVTQGRTFVSDKAVEAILPESLLDYAQPRSDPVQAQEVPRRLRSHHGLMPQSPQTQLAIRPWKRVSLGARSGAPDRAPRLFSHRVTVHYLAT